MRKKNDIPDVSISHSEPITFFYIWLYALKIMEDHCDAIIRDAKKLDTEFLEFAKWHKMRAAELQGQ